MNYKRYIQTIEGLNEVISDLQREEKTAIISLEDTINGIDFEQKQAETFSKIEQIIETAALIMSHYQEIDSSYHAINNELLNSENNYLKSRKEVTI